LGTALLAADKYSGPRPPKSDVPYLVHADNLVETEALQASEENRKGDTAYVVNGASSSARTPLAEPIFLMRSEKVMAEKLQLYRLESRNGRREIVFPEKKKKDGPKPLKLMVTRLEPGLFRVEANEGLPNGEYALTPEGSNHTFCFQVY
jgi:hypothetical protein